MENYNMQNNAGGGKLETLNKFAVNLNERAQRGNLTLSSAGMRRSVECCRY